MRCKTVENATDFFSGFIIFVNKCTIYSVKSKTKALYNVLLDTENERTISCGILLLFVSYSLFYSISNSI